MTLTISEDIMKATRMSEAEMRLEIAVMLFAADRLTLGQARRLADMDRIAFQHVLASRHIGIHYDVDDFEDDLDLLDRLTA